MKITINQIRKIIGESFKTYYDTSQKKYGLDKPIKQYRDKLQQPGINYFDPDPDALFTTHVIDLPYSSIKMWVRFKDAVGDDEASVMLVRMLNATKSEYVNGEIIDFNFLVDDPSEWLKHANYDDILPIKIIVEKQTVRDVSPNPVDQ